MDNQCAQMIAQITPNVMSVVSAPAASSIQSGSRLIGAFQFNGRHLARWLIRGKARRSG